MSKAEVISQTLHIQNRSALFLEWPKLLEYLNAHIATPMGRERLATPLLHADIAGARSALAETAALVLAIKDKKLQCHFRGISDCRELLRKANKGGQLRQDECYELFLSLSTIQDLHTAMRACSGDAAIKQLIAAYHPMEEVVAMLATVFDARGEIRDDASPALAKIRAQVRERGQLIRDRLQALLKQEFAEEFFQDDYVTLREDRLVLPLKANMRGKFRGIIHGSSATGQTLFIEPETVVQANNDHKMLCQQEQAEITRILRDISNVVSNYNDHLTANFSVACDIDLAHARAQLSIDLKGTLPQLAALPGDIHLRAARHPLMCLMGKTVVANDLLIPAPVCGLLISGANAGGKTVTLKCLGLNVLLAAAGILPAVAAGSLLPFCDHLIADIGDTQSIEEGLSTFGAHLKLINSILEAATPATLVLLDEILSGTNAEEGAALGQAVLEEMARRQIKMVISTHYTNLKNLPLSNSAFLNASMEMDGRNRPTYRLSMGVAGESNALVLARAGGLSAKLLQRAEELLGPQRREAHLLETQRHELAEQRRQLEKQAAELTRSQAELAAKLAELRQAGNAAALSEYQEFRSELASLRRRLREIGPSLKPEKALAAEKQIDRIAVNVKEQMPAEVRRSLPALPLKEGSRVRLLGSDQIGEIRQAANRHGILEIVVGNLRLKLHSDEVEAIGTPPTKKIITPKIRPTTNRSNSQDDSIPRLAQAPDNTLDLRGLSLEAATDRLQNFIDSAALSGPELLIVIHGHGTNTIKEGVRSWLTKAPYELSFRPGQGGEGGTGVTVVQLQR